MMLSTLTTIAELLGLTFIYGEAEAFNIAVDYTDPELIIMYHEGYVSGSKGQDAQGAWESSYNLRIRLLIKNNGLNDKPVDRLPRFDRLEPIMDQILTRLTKDYTITGPVSFTDGINQTDKGLDGIRFVLNATPKVVTTYCP